MNGFHAPIKFRNKKIKNSFRINSVVPRALSSFFTGQGIAELPLFIDTSPKFVGILKYIGQI